MTMEQIQKEIESVTIQYEKAIKTNDYALILQKDSQKKYVFSKYDPIQQASRLVNKTEANKETLWIVSGFCLGYVVEKIIERIGKEAKILVIEPNLRILKEQMEITGETKWREYENLKFFSGINFQELKENYLINTGFASYSNTNVIFTNEYQEYYIKYFTKVLQIISEMKVGLIIDQNTREKMNVIILSNIVKNRSYISAGYDITYHKDKYQGIPALIVSAGPSLEKNIHLVKEFQGMIFAGGRSLTPVLNQGVNPDFIVTIDPQDITYETFKGNTTTDIPLIAVPSANTQILTESQGPQYFTDNDVNTVKALTGVSVPYLTIGGSVATLGLSAAQYMGCNPIIFIGQDLAFTGMKAHSEECSINGENIIIKKNSNLKLVQGYYDEEVYSDYTFIGYMRWIEEFIAYYKDTIFINATEGGAYMRGALHQPLSEVIAKYRHISKPLIKHIQNKIKKNTVDEAIGRSIEELKKLNSYVRQGESLSKKLLNEYTVYKGIRHNQIQVILTKLDKIDTDIDNLDKKHLANQLFTEIYNRYQMDVKYQEPLKENEINKGIRVSTLNYKVYSALKSKSTEWIEQIEKAMEE